MLQFFCKGWRGRQNCLPSHRCRGPTKGWQCCFLVRLSIWKKCALWLYLMGFSNDLDFIVQVQYPPEWKSGHLDLTWSMSSVVRHKMGWEHFIHCIVGQVKTPKNSQIFFSSGEQMNVDRNSQILLFFPQWQTNGSAREPRSGGGLVHSQRIKSCDRSLCDTCRCCLYGLCGRRLKGFKLPKEIILTKEQNISIQTVSLEIK